MYSQSVVEERRDDTASAHRVPCPVSRQVIGWLLVLPLLIFMAGQIPIVDGPARDATAYQFGATATGGRGEHSYVLLEYLYFAIFGFYGFPLIWRVLKGNVLIIASLSLAMISALWSPLPTITLQMFVVLTLSTMLGCYLYARFPGQQLLNFLAFLGVIFSILNVIVVLALPSYGLFNGYVGGGHGAWQGICSHKNALGLGCGFLITAVLFTERLSRWQRVSYAAVLLLQVAMSQSRGAWLDTLGMFAIVSAFLLYRRLPALEAVLFLLLIVGFLAVTIPLLITHFDSIALALGKDPSMSGRTGIYAEVMRSILKHPWLGYGYGTFWTTANPEAARIGLAINWTNIGYAENGFLDLGLQLGFIGVGLIVAMLIMALVQGARLLRSRFYTSRTGWFLAILVFELLTNIDAGRFLTPMSFDWLMVVIACIGLNEESWNARANARHLAALGTAPF